MRLWQSDKTTLSCNSLSVFQQLARGWLKFRLPIGTRRNQPAILNADLTAQVREALQARVEKLHRSWKKDRDYLAPPEFGKLAELDPALIVTLPPGLEAGYVPIVTRQAAKE